jgi:DNA-binding CsgD family transcriptional regulator
MPSLPTLRGRDAEQATIAAALDGASAGRGGAILVDAPPGFGKTRLLAEAAAMAQARGFAVAAGAATRGTRISPMATLIAALFSEPDPLLDRAALDDLEQRPEARYWLLDEIETLLEQASRERPLLVCLDDVQWADSNTVAALFTLALRLRASPIVWIAALRRGDAGPQLRSVATRLEREGATRIELGPLDDAAIRAVVADHVAAPSPELLEVARRSEGSPFLLVELLADAAAPLEGALPQRIAETTRRRLDRLSPRAAGAAHAAAVLRTTFSVEELSGMLEAPPSALLGPVDELLRADLLAERGDRLSFRHDLLREGVLESLPEQELRVLQRRAAEVLLAGGAGPLEVAARLVASAVPGDAVAVSTLFSAAWAVAAADPSAAADLGREALRLAAPADAIRADVVSASALWLHAAGRLDEGRALTDGALREALTPIQEGRVRLSIAGMFSLSPDERARAGRIALEIPDLSEALRASHLARLVHNLVVAGRGDAADVEIPRARVAAERASDPAALFTLDLAGGARDYAAGRFVAAGANVERATVRTVGRAEDARARLADQWRSEILALADDFDAAFAVTGEGLRAAQRDGRVWTVRTWESWRGRLLLQSGQLADASAVFEGLLGDGEELEMENLAEASAGFAMGRVALHTGDARAQRASAAFAARVHATAWPELQRHGAWLLALQAAGRGEHAAARDLLMEGLDEATPILPTLAIDVTDEVRVARIALAAGDDNLLRWAADVTAARVAHNPGVASLDGAAAHVRGLVDGDVELLGEAVTAFERSPRRLALASALEDLGVALLAAGDREAAVVALGRALELGVATGAAVDARRVRERLRVLGVTRRIARAPRPVSGWSALTPSEVVVARMVAAGQTNREVADRLVVSPHTVSMHLRRAFAKLDITSRRDLPALVPADDAVAAP